MADLTIVIPAFNEADAIGPVLTRLAAVMAASGVEHEILVVDDGSTDGTRHEVQALLGKIPTLRIIEHEQNRGYGAALKSGILAADSPVVGITDADGTYPNDRLPELFRMLVARHADMVVGSRTGQNVNIPLVRRPAKAVLRLLANYITGTKIPDLNSGLRVFRTEPVIERFNLISDGFSFTTTVTLAMLVRHQSVIFVAVDYAKRTGSSKIRPFRDTLNFLVLSLRVAVYFEPMKVFVPVASALGITGLFYAGYQAWQGDLGEGPILLLSAALNILLVGLVADMISRKN
jgi:glycosyltransferase involved in cell wall biosynthesis